MKIWPFNRNIKIDAKSLIDPETWLNEIFGVVASATGASVTPTSAMRNTAVRRAVQAISEPIGQLPLHIYRKNGNDRTRDRTHNVAKVLMDPNPWTSASAFREQLQRDCLLHGNAYAYINRVSGNPKELLRLDPANVKVEVNETTGEPSYVVIQKNKKKTTYPFTVSPQGSLT